MTATPSSYRLIAAVVFACVCGTMAQPDPGRAPPDIRALDLAIDEARLDEDDALKDALTTYKSDHMALMGKLLNKESSMAAMKQIDELR